MSSWIDKFGCFSGPFQTHVDIAPHVTNVFAISLSETNLLTYLLINYVTHFMKHSSS